jgi:uncharacterized protein (TIGR00369 family)
MREIENPFTKRDNYLCFGCSKQNSFGLQMKFYEDNDEIVCYWQPNENFQGYNNVLHGGIQATLADEIASWVVFTKLKTGGVTAKLEINYKKLLFTNKGKIQLRAKLLMNKKKIAQIKVQLFNHEKTLCAEAIVSYYLLSEEKAKEKLGYPGFDSFCK